jgi:hypothetical protein
MRTALQFMRIFQQVLEDARMNSRHVSLYAALLICSDPNDWTNPFHVSRSRLMRLSRIRSISTYHKCLKELIGFGHLVYEPSYHPKKASRVTLSHRL